MHLLTFARSVATVLLLGSSAFAADAWTLTTADLAAHPVVLKSLDVSGATVAAPDGFNEREVPMAQFVELERSIPPIQSTAKFDLYLTSGDQIFGEPAAVKGESIVWKNPIAGDVEVPLRQLGALVRAGSRPPQERGREDVVTLSNKDVVRGTIADFTPTKITLQGPNGLTDLPLESINSISFAATPAAGPARQQEAAFRIRLDDGSSVIGSAVKLQDNKLNLTIGKNNPRPIDLAHIANIEQVNGPVSWLSSRTPSESVFIPFLGSDQLYPARMNANIAGEPIRFKDQVYRRGIGVHAYSRLVFPLDDKTYAAFRTRYALDPTSDVEDARLTVRIKLDDKVAYEKQDVRLGVISPPVVLELGDAKTLTLEVDCGSNLGFGGRLNWIEPALLKVKPAAEIQQPASTQPTTSPVQ